MVSQNRTLISPIMQPMGAIAPTSGAAAARAKASRLGSDSIGRNYFQEPGVLAPSQSPVSISVPAHTVHTFECFTQTDFGRGATVRALKRG